ncbi:MAG: hypothetical protein APF82_02460 [Sphingomonadales bacterium BRH_c42]|jgi:hypothetical protein|nr:MAG: hypothetical protein APF82_02460 [Sphingomonadales bacterium BRH_c42]
MSEAMINQAAWQHAPGHPLRTGVADLPQLATNEIRIRNAAIAINPSTGSCRKSLCCSRRAHIRPRSPGKGRGQGLEMLQPALEVLKAGVSAAKVVVTLA